MQKREDLKKNKKILVMCPLFTMHEDSQDKSYECPVIRQDVKVTGNYDNILVTR